MICAWESCRRPVVLDDTRRVEVRRQDDETLKAFGKGIPGYPLALAAGTLEQVFHYKCYFAYARRQYLLAAKEADPSLQNRETDWREQETCEVEDLSEGYRNP